MPTYEYTCKDCNKDFTLQLSVKEHDRGVACPACGSRNVEQKVAPVFTVTSRKS